MNEKDVENIYRAELLRNFSGGTITSPFNSDGLLEYKDIKTLLEFKYGKNLKDNKEQASVFAQLLFYMKRFEQSGEKMPNTLFVGDDTECMALSTTVLDKYLRKQIDWSTAPSSAYKLHPELVNEIANDNDILSYVFDIGVDDFKEVATKIEELAKGVVNLVPIDQSNIVEAFRYWKEHILNDTTKTTQEEVNIFIKCLIDREETYEHPRKAGVLVTSVEDRNVEVRVKMKAHLSFFSHFKREYKPSERVVIVANKDRLVDEVDRRKTGEFFTPTIWAREAHKMIAENLGENWTEEYVVWDCASGTNNLIRDLRFKELYCSTLNEEDIDTAKKMGYNPEATFFQFDFLNDSDDKLPEGLQKALKEKKVLFLINPPYGTSANKDTTGKENKVGMGTGIIVSEMRKLNFGMATQQMYTQFMYRITKYKKENESVNIGMFTPPLFISSSNFSKFNDYYKKHFRYIDGYLMDSKHFADVASWGLSFTMWGNDGESIDNVKIKVKDLDKKAMAITDRGDKTLYNSIGKELNKYVRKMKSNEKETVELAPLTSAIRVKKGEEVRAGKLEKDFLGYMFNVANNVKHNGTDVSILTSVFPAGNGIKLDRNNFNIAMNLFSVRRMITGSYANWVNWYDEYLVPNFENGKYGIWSNDTVVYSLFDSKSNQSSLRNVDYKDKKWNIKNEFFFMSNDEMKTLADDHDFLEMYNDANHFNKDRHVYNLLVDMELSDDAGGILESARELVRKSMVYRKESHQLRPEYHLNAWDSGWYQLRKGILEHYPELNEELKEFREKFRVFEDRMREGVYEFGFLKR